MNVIQPNCRVQFTAEDISFIISTLGQSLGNQQCLVQLLTDEDTRDQILDDDQLFRTLLEHRGCLRVSDHLYFYVIVRHVLRDAGLSDRRVADYVAEMLCEYAHQGRSRGSSTEPEKPLEYVFEMLAALQTADERTRFYLRAHIGNHSLFLTGVFPERIQYRAEAKGFPDLRYYEELGQTSYRAAGDHRLADRYELGPIFSTLSDQFQKTRRALNDISDRIFSLDNPDNALDKFLVTSKPEEAN